MSIFTFHLNITNRSITFSIKEPPNSMHCVDSVDARKIFEIRNICFMVTECHMFWSLFIFTQHGNLHQLVVTISRVTYFIRHAKGETDLAKTKNKVATEFGNNQGKWTGKVKIRLWMKFLPLGKACFKGRTFVSSGLSTKTSFNFCICSTPLRNC